MIKYLHKIWFAFLIFILGFSSVNASGNYTISLSSNNVTKGKSVTLYVKGNDIFGGFSVSSSDSTIASVSNSQVYVDNDTATVTITTFKAGSVTIKVSPNIVIADYTTNSSIELPSKTLMLNVTNGSSSSSNSVTNKSNDATLKSLSIDGIDISPEFKSDVLEYKATAEAGTEKIKINATTTNGKATVSGAGEVSVSDGANKLEVVVTAEDGSTKKYIINLNVKQYDPITVKIDNKDYTVVRKAADLPEVDLFELCDVDIGDDKVAGYYNDKLNIYLIGLKDEKGNIALYTYDSKKNSYIKYNWITVGGITLYLKVPPKEIENFKKYKTIIRNTNVDIYKLNKNEEIGLVYGTNVATGNTDYYLYDKKEETLARYYNKESDIYKNRLQNYRNYLVILMGIISAIIIIVIIISLIKGRKRKKNRK